MYTHKHAECYSGQRDRTEIYSEMHPCYGKPHWVTAMCCGSVEDDMEGSRSQNVSHRFLTV